MSLMTIGADVGTMLTGVSAVAAGGVWIRKQLHEWRDQRAAKRQRDWQGYIEITGINSWRVRLVEEPDSPTARVVVEVVKDNGEPDPNLADNLRKYVVGDGMLARVPSEEEYDFLKALHKERRHNGGIFIR